MILLPETVPPKFHGRAPRTFMRPSEWDRVRKKVVADAGFRCSVCKSPSRPQAHERYEIRGTTLVLTDIVCLCAGCHLAVHFARAILIGKEVRALRRMAKMNGKDIDTMRKICLSVIAGQAEEGKNVTGLDWSHIGKAFPGLLCEKTRENSLLSAVHPAV